MRLTNVVVARLGGASFIVSTFAALSSAWGQPNLKATFDAQYAAMKVAMTAHDHAAISALLAPGFISVDVTGNVETANNMIAEVDGLKADPNKTSTTTLQSIKQDGDSAMIDQRYEMHTTKTGANGAPHKVNLVTRSADMWVSQHGVWLLAKTVTVESSYSVDGKVVAHKVAR